MIASERDEEIKDFVTVYTDNVYDIVKLDTWLDGKPEMEGHWDVRAGFIEYDIYSENEERLAELEDFVKTFDGYNDDAEYVFNYLFAG